MPEDPLPRGLMIGHADDPRLKSGVTVILPEAPAVMSAHIAGGAPGGRELGLAEPQASVGAVNAVVLAGGSAFGLSAADGVMSFLAERGRGFAVAGFRVPIVPAAILFDLANGGDKAFLPAPGRKAPPNPYPALAYEACESAAPATGLGTLGAGAGATTANLKGGFGFASEPLAGGGILAAFVAVNAVGAVTLGAGPHFRAAPFERDGEFGGLGFPAMIPPDAARALTKLDPAPGANTTIAVIATDLALTKAEAKRLAIVAHDGLALAIWPAHTPYDGDTIFTLATGEVAVRAGADRLAMMTELSAAAVRALARAVARGVYAASPAKGDALPTWKCRFAKA
ncbi:P1 family peptidase [Afifella pfennigii]|uniref:P1 family peptidase n=1 Tax=Afifella pfennigii TaxID=209897 RepID=UPI000478BD8B|nr:P1 family peptidase [Afifella pfennigii]